MASSVLPFAPIVLEPAPGDAVALNNGWTFRWKFNHPSPAELPGWFAFRIRPANQPDTDWLYYAPQAGGWTNTPVYVGHPNDFSRYGQQFLIAPSDWPSGYGVWYQFQIGTANASNPELPYTEADNGQGRELNWSRAQLLYVTFGPDVYLWEPTQITGSRPTWQWEFSPYTNGQTVLYQGAYRAMVREGQDIDGNSTPLPGATDAQILSAGPLWYSGWVTSADNTFEMPIDLLPNEQGYTAYIQVRDTAGNWSSWAYQPFTAVFELPEAPVLTLVAKPEDGGVMVTADASFNLLTADGSDFDDGSLGGWVAYSNCEVEVYEQESPDDDAEGYMIITANLVFV